MKTLAALTLVLFIASCGPATTSPSPSPSAPSSLAPTATPAPTASPTQSVVATPTGTPISQPTGVALSAPSGDVVWVLVGGTRLFRSSDRGVNWQERGIPSVDRIGDIVFVSDREGWLQSPASPEPPCQRQAVAIYHSADGAATWERAYQSDVADTMCKGGLSFADAQRGFLSLSAPNSNPIVSRTADGGRTWTRSTPLPNPPGSSAASAVTGTGRVKSFGSTVLVSAFGAAGGTPVYAFRSTDGGATWSYSSTGPQQQIEIVFLSATRWLQVFLPNQSSETTDGGATWHAFTTDYSQAAPVSPQIVFGDANVGYATVRGSIQRTTDGGAHWTGIKTPGT